MLPINSHSVRNTAVLTLLFYLLLSALADEAAATDVAAQAIDLQGHRGARGLLPENTIPGFQRALELGVTTLEMDVAINAEGHAVLSHEPWMSAKICVHPDGRKVTEEEEKSLNIYESSKNIGGMAKSNFNIGESFFQQQLYKKALEYHQTGWLLIK